MTTERNRRRACVAVLCAASWLAWPCAAELVYYLPFDNGSTATLTNYGSVGGTATTGSSYGILPTASTNIYANLGGTHSEDFPMSANGQYCGRVVPPDGTNQFRLTTTGQHMTFSCWLNWRGPDGHPDLRQGIVSTLPGSQNSGWGFSVLSDGKLQISLGGGPGNRNSTNTTIVVSTNVWTHVALAYSAGGDPGFYINGTNVGLNQPYYGAKAVTNSIAIHIGNVDETYLPVNGKLDDIGMFDTKLTAGKIRALYTAPGVVAGLNLGIMNQLFNLFDAATGMTTITLGGKQQIWKYATGFTGHAAGDTWTSDAGAVFIQLDAANTGVKYVPSGTAICLF